jgi:4'-phosphopantetheinyl transferase
MIRRHSTVRSSLRRATAEVTFAPIIPLASLDCIAARSLSTGERAEIAALDREDDRRRFVTARALLRQRLASALGLAPTEVPLVRSPERSLGVAAAGAPHFSVTHAGEWVAVAVCDAPIGIDLEPVLPSGPDPLLVARVATASERAAYGTLPPQERPAAFVRLWVRKEAAVKATGCSPDRLDVGIEPACRRVRSPAGALWISDLQVGPGIPMAVAVLAGGRTPPRLEVSRAAFDVGRAGGGGRQ